MVKAKSKVVTLGRRRLLIKMFWRKSIFPRMPLITTHLHTNANHANQNEV